MKDFLLEIYNRLLERYGFQDWWPGDSPDEIIIGAILTQNVSWKNVEKAIENLKREKLLSLKRLYEVDNEEIAPLIKPTGFYNQKTIKLKNFLEYMKKYSFSIENLKKKSIEKIRKELLGIKGIGKETADSIILYALDKPTFVIDAYTKRLFFRLGILESDKMRYDDIKEIFELNLPRDLNLFKDYHAQIVVHSKEICSKKPKCNKECPLFDICKKIDIFNKKS